MIMTAKGPSRTKPKNSREVSLPDFQARHRNPAAAAITEQISMTSIMPAMVKRKSRRCMGEAPRGEGKGQRDGESFAADTPRGGRKASLVFPVSEGESRNNPTELNC